MVVNRRVEQGIYVVLMLSLEKDHRPLRSTELSSLLSVSDSYLKKILRQLVLADIITSTAGRDGGFQLAQRPRRHTRHRDMRQRQEFLRRRRHQLYERHSKERIYAESGRCKAAVEVVSDDIFLQQARRRSGARSRDRRRQWDYCGV